VSHPEPPKATTSGPGPIGKPMPRTRPASRRTGRGEVMGRFEDEGGATPWSLARCRCEARDSRWLPRPAARRVGPCERCDAESSGARPHGGVASHV